MDRELEKTFALQILGLPLLSFSYFRVWHKEVKEPKTATPEPLLPDKTLEEKDGEPIFVINSLMLYRCFKLLTRTRNEDLHAVTGSVIGKLRSLEQIVPLTLSTQSLGGAAAEHKSLANELLMLNEFGLRPLAYFHSHPDDGMSATQPSNTDRQTQATMERSGSDIIGGIFSRDGFVRFYANRGNPNTRVVGKRVREIRKNVYQLEIKENL